MTSRGELRVVAPDGMPEVRPGDDLAALVAGALRRPGTRAGEGPVDGDVVVVTSKVVSKAEGRVVDADTWEAALADETERVVASRGRTRIVRTRLGLVMAAAGIDRSNVVAGSIVLLPVDPDASARALRERLHELMSVNVAVVVTDTAGRAWRNGQTDLAVGVAGMAPLESFVGRVDAHGHELAVTEPAVADEIAGAAELAQGKLGGRPVALVRGRGDLVLPVGEHGPGARALQRPADGDMFGLGTREAVVAALAGDPADSSVFGSPASLEELRAALARVVGAGVEAVDAPGEQGGRGVAVELPDGAAHAAVAAVCFSHGWQVDRWVSRADRVVAGLSPRVP